MASIYITIGNENIFGIDENYQMFIQRSTDTLSRIYLGEATQVNLSKLKVNMDRLSLHMRSK